MGVRCNIDERTPAPESVMRDRTDLSGKCINKLHLYFSQRRVHSFHTTTWCQILTAMAFSGIKPPGHLSFEGDIATNWRRWYRSYEYYVIATGASGKAERILCSLFLHIAGPDAQTLHAQFEFDSDEREKIQPLTKKFETYCISRSNITVVRHRFHTYNQNNESMDTYIRELKARVVDCNYGQLEDSLLCDRLICGVSDEKLREKLLQTDDMTMEKCITMCRRSEVKASQVAERNELKETDAMTRDGRAPAAQAERHGPPQWRSQPTRDSTNSRTSCTWCGYNHDRDKCPARDKECNYCHKMGHFSKVCRARSRYQQPNRQQYTRPLRTLAALDTTPAAATREYYHEPEDPHNGSYNGDLHIGTIRNIDIKRRGLWYADYKIGTVTVKFKLDTGSEVNIIPTEVYSQLANTPIRPVQCRIITYSGHRIIPDGEATITIDGTPIDMLVVKDGSPILGKEACEDLQLLLRINVIETPSEIDIEQKQSNDTVKKYNHVFNGLGLIKSEAHIFVDNNVQPCIDPPRRIPHAIENDVKNELQRMLNLGVIMKQDDPTDWVNSITIVRKPNKLRICLDPTQLNKAIKRGAYPIKTIEQVSAKLHDAKYFSVLDANSGYWQIELDYESSLLCTFNTPWGRYRYTRLPFGIKTAGDIFVSEMNRLLGDLPGIQIVTDDILVYGCNINEHNARLKSLLERAVIINLKLNPKKSIICKHQVEYVGHIISDKGITPSPGRIQAITEMPEPCDKAAVQRFLGMINYVHKFIPNLSSIAEPLRITLGKNIAWHWGYEQQIAFDKLKESLINYPVLEHYNPKTDITLQVDASKSGLGAVILQNNKPVALASKALNYAQSQYAVIEK